MDTPDPACKHKRTRVIAKDDDAQYVECLDCGEILEAGELSSDEPGFGESLSDA
jgi:Zn ribbon nucleic-acid-binding protein